MTHSLGGVEGWGIRTARVSEGRSCETEGSGSPSVCMPACVREDGECVSLFLSL